MPITVSIYVYYNKSEQKLYFAIYAFKYVLVISGYLTVRNSYSVYLHIKNKAYVITLNNLINLTKNRSGGNFITPLSLYIYVDSAVNEFALSFLMLVKAISNVFNAYSYNELYYFDNYYSFNLTNTAKQIEIKASFTFSFNLFCILRLLIANSIIKRRKLWQN
ncbi:MAG: hypothetical protein IKV61_05620 [Clostridia bacterium]|nr:hypothetical protein [Clostridia bacterium]